mmetsp:Transcript_66861/g.160055  ORF Transcript_66861/g.160055 Transcript_66861/m.160055 type:complete len:469 (+) Transcript_66861:27-1433(+)
MSSCCWPCSTWWSSRSAKETVAKISPETASQKSALVPPPPPVEVERQSLSRNQQKKLAVREARREKKEQRKAQRQTDALGATVLQLGEVIEAWMRRPCSSVEELQACLKEGFGVACGYADLPQAFGPNASVGTEVLGTAVRRPDKYSAKFLPQEYSLIHKVWTLLDGCFEDAGVIDVGAGNACCAVLLASLFGVTVICVERESPRVELRAEMQMPVEHRQRVIRLESDVEDFGNEQLENAAKAAGVRRLVLLAKHPCGIGADRTIDCAARLLEPSSKDVKHGATEILGLVMATCCTNKLCLDDYHTAHIAEFCNFYCGSQSLTPSDACLAEASQPSDLNAAVEMMSRCSAWRTASGSRGSAHCAEQVELAEHFEDALQAMRLRRLRRLFGDATQVRFAPRECTLQDRCLIATRRSLPDLVSEVSAEKFISSLSSAADALRSAGGPIDCRPKGLKSTKYDFDYTADLPE